MHFSEIIIHLIFLIPGPCTFIHSIKHRHFSFSSIDRVIGINCHQTISPLLICHEAKVCISVNMTTLINTGCHLFHLFAPWLAGFLKTLVPFFNERNRNSRVAVLLMRLYFHPVQKQSCARVPCSYFRSLWSLFHRQGVPRARSKGT